MSDQVTLPARLNAIMGNVISFIPMTREARKATPKVVPTTMLRISFDKRIFITILDASEPSSKTKPEFVK